MKKTVEKKEKVIEKPVKKVEKKTAPDPARWVGPILFLILLFISYAFWVQGS